MSARAQDGMHFPLHFALEQNQGVEVIEALLRAHPEAASTPDEVLAGARGVGGRDARSEGHIGMWCLTRDLLTSLCPAASKSGDTSVTICVS